MRVLAGRATDGFPAGLLATVLSGLSLGDALLPTAAQAQFAGNVSLMTSEMFRGESTSGDDAAASLEISYDHASGLFAGASVTIAGGERSLHYNGSNQYVGYAWRQGETSLEFGAIHRDYAAGSLFDEAYSPHYFEGFFGYARRNLRMRIYVSPDYLRDGGTTYYGEVNGRLAKMGQWSLNGHGGVSAVPADLGDTGMRFYYDWSLQANRALGGFALGLGIAATNYPVFGPDKGPGFLQNSPRIFASISRAF
jgi:uncharacterized protein (TIGR02001 family)